MNILLCTLRALAEAITNPYYLFILALLTLMLYRKNKKSSIMQRMIMGEIINSPFELTISQIVIGIFGGVLASIILSYLGVIFDETSGIYLLFLLSIILMMWSPRLICFSYSGAVLGFASITLSVLSKILKVPEIDTLKIDITALMTLIAVLHFVEGILVIFDGKRGAIPVFSTRDNKIVGGFALQRYWIFPVAVFLLTKDKSLVDLGTSVSTPGWWPIIPSALPNELLKSAVIALITFYGVIGYNSVTFTKSPQEKSNISGFLIIIYSVVLFGLAQLANINIFFKIFVLIFAPAAHEGMLNYQNHLEIVRKPKYISSEDGMMVLAVTPNSPADEIGIESGDLVIKINDIDVKHEIEIQNMLKMVSNFISLKVRKQDGRVLELSYNKMNESKKLGIVFVPRGLPKDSMVVNLEETKFREILDKMKQNNDDNDDDNDNK